MIQLSKTLVPDGQFMVAVSGGVDSIAAAHLLKRIYKDRLVGIFHFNHNTRFQNFVMMEKSREFAFSLGLNFHCSFRDKKDDISESALREDRLQAMKELGSDLILCQHLDDAVESYVMNMLRGCPEYTPIPEVTAFHQTDKFIYRPFLKTRKKDFIDYAKNNDLMKYVEEDETNENTTYRRNFIRHEVLPMFADFGLPKVVLRKFYLNV